MKVKGTSLWSRMHTTNLNVPQETNFPFPHRHTNSVIVITLVIKIKHGSQMLCSYGRVVSQQMDLYTGQ